MRLNDHAHRPPDISPARRRALGRCRRRGLTVAGGCHRPSDRGQQGRPAREQRSTGPARATSLLPAPLRPQLVNGWAVAGVCLIRLRRLRPRGLPGWAGMRTENAAHRVAAEWDGTGGRQSGVYIPRRDSDSAATVLAGGRLFPGEHHRASFDVRETDRDLHVSFASADGMARYGRADPQIMREIGQKAHGGEFCGADGEAAHGQREVNQVRMRVARHKSLAESSALRRQEKCYNGRGANAAKNRHSAPSSRRRSPPAAAVPLRPG